MLQKIAITPFFNSSYYAHRENRANDIYSTNDEKKFMAYSPVTGRIKKIYDFKPPTSMDQMWNG